MRIEGIPLIFVLYLLHKPEQNHSRQAHFWIHYQSVSEHNTTWLDLMNWSILPARVYYALFLDMGAMQQKKPWLILLQRIQEKTGLEGGRFPHDGR